jgi:hypothetical protein
MENISESNLKLLLNYYSKNKENINEIIDYYNPTEGYIYCMHNEIFNYYGEDVIKCGNSSNPDKRILQYTTSYPKQSNILKISEKYFDKNFAETLLFYYLREFRLEDNREFFKCNINIINDAFIKVNNFFIKYNTKKLIFDYLIGIDYSIYFMKDIESDKYKLIQSIKETNLQNLIKNIIVFENENNDTFDNILSKELF